MPCREPSGGMLAGQLLPGASGQPMAPSVLPGGQRGLSGNICSEWTPENRATVGAFPNGRERAPRFLESE